MYASESCTHPPRTVYIAGALGQIRYKFDTQKCTCVDFGGALNPAADVWANPDNGFCYAPPQMFAAADRLTYKPSEADKPINLEAVVNLVNDRMKSVDIRVGVIPSEGEPGTVTSPLEKTGEDGVFRATYKFPKFDKKRTDTLVFTCGICAGSNLDVVKIDITMSPTLVGFFNGVGNTEFQANAGLKALQAQTDTLRDKASVKYDLFYNQTGSANGSNVSQDLAEVFEQRANELDGVLANR